MANERRPQDGLEKPQSTLEGLSDRQKDEMYELLEKDKERRSSWPTAHLSGSLGHYLSIIKNNRPGITDEEAMSIYAGYLIPRSSRVKDDDGNLKYETFYYLNDRKFCQDEVLPKMFPEWSKKSENYLDSQSDGEVLHKNEHADSGYRKIRKINPHTTIKKASSEEREELKKHLDSQSECGIKMESLLKVGFFGQL